MTRLGSIAASVVIAAVASVLGTTGTATASGPDEDSPGFDCRVDGNRVCGPGNAQGVPAGDYGDTWRLYVDYSAGDDK